MNINQKSFEDRPNLCRCADEVGKRNFKQHLEWKMWLNGGGRLADGTYPADSWLSNYVAQVDGPAPINAYPEDMSWCGIHGMAGQVREWCSDWYDPDYYLHSTQKNPQGPEKHGSRSGHAPCRVMRGGSWLSPPYTSRGAQRLFYPPGTRDTNDHGFRPVI